MYKYISTAVFQYNIFSILNTIVRFKFCLLKKETSFFFFNKSGKIENNANLKQNDDKMLMLKIIVNVLE